jgi:hypothetical protein
MSNKLKKPAQVLRYSKIKHPVKTIDHIPVNIHSFLNAFLIIRGNPGSLNLMLTLEVLL